MCPMSMGDPLRNAGFYFLRILVTKWGSVRLKEELKNSNQSNLGTQLSIVRLLPAIKDIARFIEYIVFFFSLKLYIQSIFL